MTLDMKPVVCPLFILFFRCLTWGRKEKERKEKKRKKEKIPIKKKGRLLVRWRAERANKTTRRRRRRRRKAWQREIAFIAFLHGRLPPTSSRYVRGRAGNVPQSECRGKTPFLQIRIARCPFTTARCPFFSI